jgi:hypothetical protein
MTDDLTILVTWITSFLASYAVMFWIAYISAQHTIGG